MGGERQGAGHRRQGDDGSSPRGRGTRLIDPVRVANVRFIPAWAGNARSLIAPHSTGPVHPRVGGERVVFGVRGLADAGSSPRGRGTRRRRRCDGRGGRFIPAWAGNAGIEEGHHAASPVQPRVGGERGPHDRVIGVELGSSPRGRGTLVLDDPLVQHRRFIPAWAGNARTSARGSVRRSVHPRVGGERSPSRPMTSPARGSSPRGRGTLVQGAGCSTGTRFIPAWAGNASGQAASDGLIPVHPRVGGERSRLVPQPMGRAGSSPRGRGTRPRRRRPARCRRFIPAWAGNARCLSIAPCRTSVHPRVGGERAPSSVIGTLSSGSSPRGRGTRSM